MTGRVDAVQVLEAFFRWVAATGAALPLKRTTDEGFRACWCENVDGDWWVAVNPWDTVVRVKGAEDHEVKVPEFSSYVEFQGWPAGILRFGGEGQFAADEAANLSTFCAALVAAAERLERGGDDGSA